MSCVRPVGLGCAPTHPPTSRPTSVFSPWHTHTLTHTQTNTHTPKQQVDTIDGLVSLVPIALSRLGVASERAALKKDIKVCLFGEAHTRVCIIYMYVHACPWVGSEGSRGKGTGGVFDDDDPTPFHIYIHSHDPPNPRTASGRTAPPAVWRSTGRCTSRCCTRPSRARAWGRSATRPVRFEAGVGFCVCVG